MNVRGKRKRSSGTGEDEDVEVEIHSDSVDDEGKQTAAARPPIVLAPPKRNRSKNYSGHSQETFVQKLAGVCTSPYPPAQTEVSSIISLQRAQLDQAYIQLEARLVFIARKHLHEGHAIVQSRGGTDNIYRRHLASLAVIIEPPQHKGQTAH